jgi:hypothetical protein
LVIASSFELLAPSRLIGAAGQPCSANARLEVLRVLRPATEDEMVLAFLRAEIDSERYKGYFPKTVRRGS